MKSNLALRALFVAAALFASSAFAAPPPQPDTSKYKMLIGTGASGGTYDTMARELMDKCAQGDTFGITNSGGSLDNITKIIGNKLDAGIVQEDNLFLKKATNPDVNQLKTVFTLHPEEVHVFALRDGKVVIDNGREWYGAKKDATVITFNSFESLRGYKVAAWGGSYDTARLLANNSGTTFDVIQADGQDAAFDMLNKGAVQAVIAVAGAPAPNFEKLSATYKLIGFGQQTVTSLVSIYYGGYVLNYPNLRSEGVPTIATRSELVTRDFTGDGEMLAALSQLRGCFQQAVPVLRTTRGKHAKWLKVIPTEKGKWTYYDLPTAPTAPTKGKR